MKSLIYIIFILFFTQCAQQSMLTGGDKDIISPRLNTNKTNPANHTVNFNSRTIRLVFDEYISMKNSKKKFFVNPPVENITLEEKGKSIIIHVKEPLIENTTYTFNFGNSIKDITENNPYHDFKYVVSTGSFIDSNQYSGFVYDAFTKKPIENTTVFLYENLIDSFPTELKPNYIGISNKNGEFQIEYLKTGNYYVVAIEDNNMNNSLDKHNEKIAFSNYPITAVNLTDSVSLDSLLLFQHDIALRLLSKQYKHPGKIVLIFNKKVDLVKFSIEDHKIIQNENPASSDTLIYWLDQITSSPFNVYLEVAEENYSTEFKLTPFSSKSTDSVLHLNNNSLQTVNPENPLKLIFDHPIKTVDTNKIHLFYDTTEMELNYHAKANICFFEIPDFFNSSFIFLAEPGAFKSTYGFKNDSIKLIFNKKEEKSFGNIILKVNCSRFSSFIVQLIKQEKEIKSFYSSKEEIIETIRFCLPGNYSLRIIEDNDKNGKWTPGDYNKKQQPEKVYYYPDNIEVRAGWDNDINWIIK